MSGFRKDVSLANFVKKLISELFCNKKLRSLKFVALVPYLNVTQTSRTTKGNLDEQCTVFFNKNFFTTTSRLKRTKKIEIGIMVRPTFKNFSDKRLFLQISASISLPCTMKLVQRTLTSSSSKKILIELLLPCLVDRFTSLRILRLHSASIKEFYKKY